MGVDESKTRRNHGRHLIFGFHSVALGASDYLSDEPQFQLSTQLRDDRFGIKVGLIVLKWDRASQNVQKYDLKKSRICPIWGQSDPLLV